MSGLTCATAPGMEFASYDDLKQHYKTDWHRYNLKRKASLRQTRARATLGARR